MASYPRTGRDRMYIDLAPAHVTVDPVAEDGRPPVVRLEYTEPALDAVRAIALTLKAAEEQPRVHIYGEECAWLAVRFVVQAPSSELLRELDRLTGSSYAEATVVQSESVLIGFFEHELDPDLASTLVDRLLRTGRIEIQCYVLSEEAESTPLFRLTVDNLLLGPPGDER